MKNVIAVDLGGTSIKFGIVNEAGVLLYESAAPTMSESATLVLNNIKAAVRQCFGIAEQRGLPIAAIGIGTPGIVDVTGRVVLGGAENIAGWVNIHLSDELEDDFHVPVSVSNDANMMGLGEQWCGAARHCSDVIFITIGTGVGGAIIIGGNLYGGYANRGAELGHIPLVMDGKPCSCGSVGCFEAYASTSALVEEYTQLLGGAAGNVEINGKQIVDAYHSGVPEAVQAMNNHFKCVGRGIAGLVNIFSPQKVVVGGGISEAGSFYIENITRAYKKHTMLDCSVNTAVCAAQLGNKAGLYGAARWALQVSR